MLATITAITIEVIMHLLKFLFRLTARLSSKCAICGIEIKNINPDRPLCPDCDTRLREEEALDEDADDTMDKSINTAKRKRAFDMTYR
jgi:hypothetical protein